jgi:hypothetical protein
LSIALATSVPAPVSSDLYLPQLPSLDPRSSFRRESPVGVLYGLKLTTRIYIQVAFERSRRIAELFALQRPK